MFQTWAVPHYNDYSAVRLFLFNTPESPSAKDLKALRSLRHILPPSDEHQPYTSMTGRGKTGRSDSKNWNDDSNPPAPPLQVSPRTWCISFLQSLVFCTVGKIMAEAQTNPLLPKPYTSTPLTPTPSSGPLTPLKPLPLLGPS